MTTPHYAVIGNPISHSLSPKIHQRFGAELGIDLVYDTLLGDVTHFESQVSAFFASDGKGLNVTLPFKSRAYAMAKVRTKRCEEAKAANTLWMEQGILHADNTDGIGFITDVTKHLNLNNLRVLILGAGGAARGILGELFNSPIHSLSLANRTEENAKILQHDFQNLKLVSLSKLNEIYDLVINATSAGLSHESFNIPERLWVSKPFCYDLSYTIDRKTPFVTLAHQHQCQATDGLGMLIEQAAVAFEIWHGIYPKTWQSNIPFAN